MIRVVTGNPGAGKTLRGVEFLVKAKAEGRPIYAHGINELSPDLGVLPCNPRDWQDLPDGSIIVVDEAQNVWPSGRRTDVPADIRALSTHRHRGFDFVLLTQNPGFIDKYVRDLAGEHEHVFRQWGTGLAKIVTWQGVVDEPRQPSAMARGTESYWRYKKDLYKLYKSSTMHTVKTKVPLRIKLIPVLLVAVAIMAFMGWRAIHAVTNAPKFGAVDPVEPIPAAGVPMAAGSQKSEKGYASPEAYTLAHLPRIPTDPGSAPIFDGRDPVAVPQLFCASREDGYCVCHTEQGTSYAIPRSQCLTIARNGLYNPYFRAVAQSGTTSGTTQSTSSAAGTRDPGYQELPLPKPLPRNVYPPQSAPSLEEARSLR